MHLFGLCFLLSLPGLLANAEGHDMQVHKTPIHITMLGNVDILQRPSAIMEFVISGVLVRCLFWSRSKQLAEAAAARESEVTPADFSVLLSGLPETMTDAASLKQFVSRLDPSFDVISTTLSIDCADLIRKVNDHALLRSGEHALRAQLFLLRRRCSGDASSTGPTKLQKLLGHSYRATSDQRTLWQLERLTSELDAARAKVKESNCQINEELERSYKCTGFAFVTFNEEASAQACIRRINRGEVELKGCRLKAERPPEPEEIYWDQLQVKHHELLRRQFLACAALLAPVLLGTAAIAFANFGISKWVAHAHSLLSMIGLQASFTVLIIVANVIVFILTPVLAAKVERHYTFGGKELSCFCKMLGFQILNTVVASCVSYFFSDLFSPDRHTWYSIGGPMVLNVLFGDLAVITILIDLIRPEVLFKQHVLAPSAHTQQEMNIAYTPRADIYIAFRLQLVAKAICIGLIYGAALPACYLLTTIACWVSMWVDRYNLLRRLAPPPRSPDALIGTLLTVILPAALAVHLFTTWLFYSEQLQLVRTDARCERGDERLPDSKGPRACQTAHTLRHAEDSVWVCTVSLMLWGSFIVFYCWREAVREVDRGLHLVGEATVATFVDVLTVQDSKSHLLPPSPGTFRRQRDELALYTPPLPQWIMQKLGLVSTGHSGHERRVSVTGSGRSFLADGDVP